MRKIKKKVVEVQRGDLVGQFLGSAEDKTATINEAKGRVLFVDEAYRLTPRSSDVDYGCIPSTSLGQPWRKEIQLSFSLAIQTK